MATIKIMPGCSPDKKSVTVIPGVSLTFDNRSGGSCTINFSGPSPCPGIRTFTMPDKGTNTCTVGKVASKTNCPYTTTCNPSDSGIIIVDPGIGGAPSPGKPKKEASAKPAAKRPKVKPEAKPKKESKAKPNGKGKAKGKKKAAPKRKAGKGRSKKK